MVSDQTSTIAYAAAFALSFTWTLHRNNYCNADSIKDVVNVVAVGVLICGLATYIAILLLHRLRAAGRLEIAIAFGFNSAVARILTIFGNDYCYAGEPGKLNHVIGFALVVAVVTYVSLAVAGRFRGGDNTLTPTSVSDVTSRTTTNDSSAAKL